MRSLSTRIQPSLAGLVCFAGLVVAIPATSHAAPQVEPTFQSLGLYWNPAGGSPTNRASVTYQATGDSTWKTGYPLWFDARDSQYRGAIVGLRAGTTYNVSLTLASGLSESVTVSTWSESFPVAQTITLPASSNQTLNISQSGTASGYILYNAAAGGSFIDVANAAATNITITGSYVIVRGLTLRGAQEHGIRIDGSSHDIVIEENDISGWGTFDTDAGCCGPSSALWGMYGNAGVYSAATAPERIIIQRNRIHHPRTDTNSWGENRAKYNSYHPRGPHGIYLVHTAGHHVIRYNEIVSDPEHMFMDGMGGDGNFSTDGFPNQDSDINGNLVMHTWDDAIESEGANRNVRIWGNYIDRTTTGVASSSTSLGPLYIFRNVYNRGRYNQTVPLDSDGRLYFGKAGSVSPYGGGRRYFFHNTLLQADGASEGATLTLGAGSGFTGNGTSRPVENTISRNNIWHIWKTWWASIDVNGGAGNDVDYDLYNGVISANAGAEAHGIHDVPIYAPGNGWTSEANGLYQLDAASPGFNAGEPLANFNDGYVGAAPDIGAAEAGAPAMQFGVDAYRTPIDPPPPPPPPTLPLAINAGGAAVSPFIADTMFTGGTAVTNWTGAIDRSGVASPAPEAVYQSERYGNMTYTVGGLAAGSEYDVRLHFCENYGPSSNVRSFNVALNGTAVLTNFSIFTTTGALHKADVEEFRAAADTAGRLTIVFTTIADNALINGIEVLEVTPPPPPPVCGTDGVCAQGESCCGPSGAEHCVVVGTEVCDGFDNDCDGAVDELSVCAPPVCNSPLLLCNGACMDVTGDVENCGACGAACAAGESCVSGACQSAAPVGVAPASCACDATTPQDTMLVVGFLVLLAGNIQRRRLRRNRGAYGR